MMKIVAIEIEADRLFTRFYGVDEDGERHGIENTAAARMAAKGVPVTGVYIDGRKFIQGGPPQLVKATLAVPAVVSVDLVEK